MTSKMTSRGQGSWQPGRRQFYGIAEIAEAIGVDRQLVTVWRRRQTRGMPLPDDELASGPLWSAATIEPWIQEARARLASDRGIGGTELTPALARRAVRRLLRLIAVLLEDPRRPAALARALAALQDVASQLPEPESDRGAVEGLEDLVELLNQLGPAIEAVRSTEPSLPDPHRERILDQLQQRSLAALPKIIRLVSAGHPG